MFMISVLYPAGHDFNVEYYNETHLPLVRRLFEPLGMTELAYWRPVEEDPDAAYQLIARFASTHARMPLRRSSGTAQRRAPTSTASPQQIRLFKWVPRASAEAGLTFSAQGIRPPCADRPKGRKRRPACVRSIAGCA